MPVENVFKPKTVNEIDPKVAEEKKEGSKGYWQQKADEAKARHDYMEYNHDIKMLEGQPPESPFKVTGEVNLGKFDFQEQQRKAQEAAEKTRQEMGSALKEERERVTRTEQELYKERIESLRHDFASQISELNKTIERLLTANKRDERPIHEQFKEQYSVLQDLAKSLGYEKTGAGQDPMVAIELKKMDYQQAREDREFKWKMRQDDKKWQIELQQLQDGREHKKAELEQQGRRDELIFSAPQQIGAAIAKGLIEHEGGEPHQSRGISQEQPGGTPQTYKVPAKEGEHGEIDCPNCHTAVGIGPTTALATCIGCGSKFEIERVPAAKDAEPMPAEEEQ